MQPIVQYKNGNYTVTLDLRDGTKIRENDLNFFDADFPESMDIKLTNRCNMGCKFCHENSTCDGKHGDIMSESFIDHLHPYTELSLGGGNVLEHPDFITFLEKCKKLKLICSVTVNQKHFLENATLLKELCNKKLIYGLGISLTKPTDEFIGKAKEFPTAVIHVINGIVSISDLEKLSQNNLKLLILGYKEIRRGNDLYSNLGCRATIDMLKVDLYNKLPTIVNDGWFNVVSFDNLAIQQLNPKRCVGEERWNALYMGDDGINGELTSASMYVDMVEREFAVNSCSLDRYPIMNNVEDMFNHLKYNTNNH